MVARAGSKRSRCPGTNGTADLERIEQRGLEGRCPGTWTWIARRPGAAGHHRIRRPVGPHTKRLLLRSKHRTQGLGDRCPQGATGNSRQQEEQPGQLHTCLRWTQDLRQFSPQRIRRHLSTPPRRTHRLANQRDQLPDAPGIQLLTLPLRRPRARLGRQPSRRRRCGDVASNRAGGLEAATTQESQLHLADRLQAGWPRPGPDGRHQPRLLLRPTHRKETVGDRRGDDRVRDVGGQRRDTHLHQRRLSAQPRPGHTRRWQRHDRLAEHATRLCPLDGRSRQDALCRARCRHRRRLGYRHRQDTLEKTTRRHLHILTRPRRR